MFAANVASLIALLIDIWCNSLVSDREKYRLPMLSDVDSGLRVIVNYDDALRTSLSGGPCFLLLGWPTCARARPRDISISIENTIVIPYA